MIARTTCQLGLAQAGELQINGVPFPRSFIEIEQCNPAIPVGPLIIPAFGPVTHSYEVQMNGGGNSIVQLYIDQIAILNQPGFGVNWYGNSSQFMAETHSQSDQTYGGVNAKQSLAYTADGEFNPATGYSTHQVHFDEYKSQAYLANSLPAGGTNVVAAGIFVWDTACPN